MLVPGTRLGVYEIVAAIGAGGMGEIYRARDTRLDRTVAIKVLAASLAGDPQLRDRFEREARAISSLSHPHICALFDVGHQDLAAGSGEAGVDYLVLEYLEGETVAERLAGVGALDPPAALKVAMDICDALNKAHRSGIVHRDLKPANVMLTKAGAKLLDFGLAKLAAPVVATSGLSMLPTTPPNMTMQGTLLGTFQYMAPEQIEGLEADQRSDIFAFGALLFEMLTGRTAFEGKTRASLLGAILKDEPPAVSLVQPLAPAPLDRIISTCLAKDPEDRYQSARDLLRDLTWVASGSGHGAAAAARTVTPARSNRVAWLAAAVVTLALVAMAVIALRRAGDAAPAIGPVQFTIVPPENVSFGGPAAGGTGIATQVAISPDGRNVVFTARSQSVYQIWLRPVAALVARAIPGTEGGAFPFWSPDGRFIGFFAGGKLKKVQIAGGPPIVLCDAPDGRGGSWNRDNVILFTPGTSDTGLLRVSSAGGVPAVVTTLDTATGETNHRWPYFLPDGRHFLYTATTGACCPASKPSIVRVASLDPAAPTITLLQAESSTAYASGHVLFARDETLMALPFDPDTRQSTGDAFPLAEHVSMEGSRYVGASVSENGTLVYAGGGLQAAQQLTWFDRSGRALAPVGVASAYLNLALSPDERRVAVTLGTGTPENLDIWVIDIARNVPSRLTFDPLADGSPIWSPNGTRIAFGRMQSPKFFLFQKLINGTAADELLLEGSRLMTPTGWSADGRFIAYTIGAASALPTRFDLWVLPLFGDRKPFPLAQSAFNETSGVFAPDGRWIAYVSDDGGQPNVYVQPFPPTGGGQFQVTKDGGAYPVWRADSKELFYLALDGTLMAVPIDAADQFEIGVPQALFLTGAARFNNSQVYAVTKDGKRVLVNARPQQSGALPLTVVINWTAAIQK